MKKTRFEVFLRDNFTCKYCGRKAPDVVLSIDHIHPKSKGGTNETKNLVTACVDCNREKGDMVLTQNVVSIRKARMGDSIFEYERSSGSDFNGY